MKILLVDDDEMLRKCLRTSLESQGHEVTTVSDGQQALIFLKSWSCDVVVTDYQMPRMNGLELAAHCVNEFHKPVVLMSAEPSIGDLIEARGLHIPFLKKPFRLVELEVAVRAAPLGEINSNGNGKGGAIETKASVN